MNSVKTVSFQDEDQTRYSSNTRWWLACVVLVLCFIAFDSFLLTNVTEKFDDAPPKVQITPQEVKQKTLNTSATMMEMVNVTLPPLPSAPQKNVKHIIDETPESKIPTNQTERIKGLKKQQAKIGPNKGVVASEIQTQYMSEMVKLKGDGFQIDMPASRPVRERIGKFLYKCVGVQLAHIETRDDQKGIVYLSNAIKDPSAILRQVNGEVFANERGLVSLYGSGDRLVRVYPSWLDAKLSHHIGLNLQGQALTQFSAQYTLHNNLLQLVNISVNNQTLQQVWTLVSGFERGC